MAEERDEVASTAVAALRAEIERTRTRIAATVDAIEERLRPRHLMAEAGESIREAAVRPLQTARRHPGLTVAVAGVMLAVGADLVRRRVKAASSSRVPRAIAMVALSAALAGPTSRLHAQAPSAAKPNVTLAGCMAQLPNSVAAPPTGHEQEAAKGLALTRVAMPRAQGAADQSFWVVGPRAPELVRFVGKRVELTGPLDDRQVANSGQRSETAGPPAPSRAIAASSFRVLAETCS